MSWHKKDWLQLAGLLGLGATGLGAAGVGPLAGLLGETGAAGGGLLGNWDKAAKGLALANQFMGADQKSQPVMMPKPQQAVPIPPDQLAEILKRLNSWQG